MERLLKSMGLFNEQAIKDSQSNDLKSKFA